MLEVIDGRRDTAVAVIVKPTAVDKIPEAIEITQATGDDFNQRSSAIFRSTRMGEAVRVIDGNIKDDIDRATRFWVLPPWLWKLMQDKEHWDEDARALEVRERHDA